MINNLKNDLLSILIGLARATENNESLITATTNQLMIESLYVTISNENYNTNQIQELINKLENEKKRLIPNCYQCEASCGRNDNYNINNLEKEKTPIKHLKLLILQIIQNLALDIYYNAILNDDIYAYLYKALVIIGLEGLNENYLQNIIEELKDFKKCEN